jgi:hypothetical protein
MAAREKMTGEGVNRGGYERNVVTCVTIGVTGGLMGFASDCHSIRSTSDAQRGAAGAKLVEGERGHDGSRGKFVEIIFSPVSRKAAKPLKKMVGTTGIEPVTPTMSR